MPLKWPRLYVAIEPPVGWRSPCQVGRVGYYPHCTIIGSSCMSYGAVPKSRGVNRVPAGEQFHWIWVGGWVRKNEGKCLLLLKLPPSTLLPQLLGRSHLASSGLRMSPNERAEWSARAPYKGLIGDVISDDQSQCSEDSAHTPKSAGGAA
ncbi:hypothetical protein Bbelb_399060 [Branchiostoma belcheri]|nr:hypothetical protein Bbelb_399060 [Branchiostoma belcheri]